MSMSPRRFARTSARLALLLATAIALPGCGPSAEMREAAVGSFDLVAKVFQHPRCANCHIPGDQPLQFDAGTPHAQAVVRGPEGEGAPGLPCSTCHGEANPPASYGPHQPPGAPHWALPPPDQRMAWIGLPPAQLCAMIKDRSRNGDRDLAAMLKHVSEDKLVLWGWDPGHGRAPVGVAHAEFVAAFTRWIDGGAPCPAT
jgi:hypothetical protein